MRPKLTPKAQQALTTLGKKGPQDSDLFEQTVGQTITKLSMSIEQGNNAVVELERALTEAKETLTKSVGEYAGWADALASYYTSQTAKAAGEAGVPVAANGGTMPTVDEVPAPAVAPDVDVKPKD